MKVFSLLLFFSFISYSGFAQWSLDIEAGIPFQGYNEVRIPNATGTTFDFSKDFELDGLVIPFRIRPGYSFGKNHIFGLYAPLGINYSGPSPRTIQFQQSKFPQGEQIQGFYQFNSYRLTYRRDIVQSDQWTIGIGFTAKIRDATVELTSEGRTDRKDDVGFVPLLHIYTAYHFDNWTAYLEGDGLAGGPGRAFDFFLGAKAPLNNNLSLKGGYRILEGGAAIDEVYNFTLINFAMIGVIWEF